MTVAQNIGFFLEMLGGIADELAARGYSMLLSKTTRDPCEWIANIVASRRVDGVIVIGQSLHHEHLNELAASHTNTTDASSDDAAIAV